MSLIGNGNIKGKVTKKDRIENINSTLEKMSEKQLIMLQGLVLDILEITPAFTDYQIKANKNLFIIKIIKK